MSTSIKYPTSINAVQKTLDAQLLSGATASVTLSNVTSIQDLAGVFVVDAVDANGTATPSKREYVIFTGVSGSTLTGLTRNADGGGSDQDHAVGAIVQFVSDVLQQQAILDGLLLVVTTAGALNKASGSEVTTGTDDAKIVTAKAISDAGIGVSPVKASSAEVVTGTDDAKFATPAALAGIDTKTSTYTNKRVTKRVQGVADAATITPSWDDDDDTNITAIAQAFTLANPDGTPTANQTIVIRILDDGTGRAITYGAGYRAIGVTLPTTTTASKTIYLGCKWNVADTKTDVIAVSEEA